MSTIRRNRNAKLFAAGLPLAALAALLAVFVMWAPGSGGGRSAEAAVDPAVDFSVSATGCNSSGSPTATCTVAAGATFTLAFNLNALPGNGSFDGYDAKLNYSSGLTTSSSGLTQTGAGNWPGCVFSAFDFISTPGQAVIGCTIGVGGASSTYTGALLHLDFTCPSEAAQQTITVLGGAGNTDTVDATLASHNEAADETLTISCGASGPTPTPCEPNCPTATPTPMATPTPAGVCGDANGDGSTNSLDSFWVLQLDAGLVDHLARPELADLNHDGHVNSIDASIMLQIDAGLYHCA